jgi:2-polyprenyl-3-methyl-5-hydroxy-6-metoxy-1,4-benzoquinol methylase
MSKASRKNVQNERTQDLDSSEDIDILAAFRRYKFYHVIQLTETISTPGYLEFVAIQKLVLDTIKNIDMVSKRVLDIGCRDGLFSFEAEKLGSSEVIGIDNNLSKPAVEFLIPYFKSKIMMYEMNLFDLKEESFGMFDIVIFAGVLYHLRYPFWGLKIIRDVLKDKGTLILETAILRDANRHALLWCPTDKESPYEPSSITFFNEKGLRDTLNSLGIIIESATYLPETSPNIVRTELGAITRGCFTCSVTKDAQDIHTKTYWDSLHNLHDTGINPWLNK